MYTQEKDNLRGVLSDYMDVCDERKEVNYKVTTIVCNHIFLTAALSTARSK